MKVLVFLEQRDGVLKTSGLEALSLAYKIAEGKSENIFAVVMGDNITSLAAQTKGYGVDKVYTVNDAALGKYNTLHYTKAFVQVVEKCSPQVILGIASPMGRDLFARTAARLKAGLLTDIIDVNLEGGFKGGTKPMYAGKILAQVEYTDASAIKMMTIRPNVFSATITKGEAHAEEVNVSGGWDDRLTTVSITKGTQAKADLTEASRIISGGRALGSSDNFKILNECADVLHATVGASRAAVDAGYAAHDMQVGQTGKTVNPQLYIACGISGSIQHMAGMRTSKIIVAVNTDADAPIFSIADYGIVADLFEVVPALTKELKTVLS